MINLHSSTLSRLGVLIGIFSGLLAHSGHAQNMLEHVFNAGFRDMAEIKRKAEAGDPVAQCSLANTLQTQLRAAEALHWYGKAAEKGSVEGVFNVGRLLMFGGAGNPPALGVQARPDQGVQFIFAAATNRYVPAYHTMYRAYKDGLGVKRDMVQAYAWLQLHVDKAPGFIAVSRAELNSLALQVDVATSQEGKRLARLYGAGKWPTLAVEVPPQNQKTAAAAAVPATKPASAPDLGLTLQGIASGRNPVAVINGKSLMAGETAAVQARGKALTLKCIRVDSDSSVVLVDGESEPRVLRMR